LKKILGILYKNVAHFEATMKQEWQTSKPIGKQNTCQMLLNTNNYLGESAIGISCLVEHADVEMQKKWLAVSKDLIHALTAEVVVFLSAHSSIRVSAEVPLLPKRSNSGVV
jgi:hypothetical protein